MQQDKYLYKAGQWLTKITSTQGFEFCAGNAFIFMYMYHFKIPYDYIYVLRPV